MLEGTEYRPPCACRYYRQLLIIQDLPARLGAKKSINIGLGMFAECVPQMHAHSPEMVDKGFLSLEIIVGPRLPL